MSIKSAVALSYQRHLINLIYLIIIFFFYQYLITKYYEEIPIYAFYFFAIWKCIPAILAFIEVFPQFGQLFIN